MAAAVELAAVMLITGCGGGGGETPAQVNRPPAFARSSALTVTATTLHFMSYDASQGGALVVDPDGDPLTYSFGPCSCTQWLTIDGARLTGTPPGPGSYQISFTVSDGRGTGVLGTVNLVVTPNSVPVAARPNGPRLVLAGSHINYDATQGGTTFTDGDGDVLTYEVELLSPPRGLAVVDNRIVGSMEAVGSVIVRIAAEDGYGGRAENMFAFAVAAPEPSSPTLPATPYVYDDAKLPLPPLFRRSITQRAPLWDTTPSTNKTSDAGATLGRVLFYDTRLSITNTHACASCHVREHGFTTPERFPTGVAGLPLRRNAMALTNVRYNQQDRYFGDARVETLERLALMPIEELTELGNSLPLLEEKLSATSFYPPLFTAAFGSPEITSDRIAKALAQFLRALLSYRTKFDSSLVEISTGVFIDPATVFTPLELRGRDMFNSSPLYCSGCHSGAVQTLDRPQNNGLDLEFADPGDGDGEFRAPSLRNVALTAPYMHDGRFATLREVVDHYFSGMRFKRENGAIEHRQLNMDQEANDALVAFLHTLTDDSMITDPRFANPFE